MVNRVTTCWRGVGLQVGDCDTEAAVAGGDKRLNWPSVTLHIPASELGVMGKR